MKTKTKTKRLRWTEEEKRLLREFYPHMTTREFAPLVGRNANAVKSYAQQRGIYKTPEQRKRAIAAFIAPEVRERANQTRRATFKSERRRWKNDLPQRTRIYFSGQTRKKVNYRRYLRLLGYIEYEDEKNVAYYDDNTHRSARCEATALSKYNIKILQLPK